MSNNSKKKATNHKHTIKELDVSSVQGLSPSSYMRARRPELFSDTKIVAEPRLTREVFEYHLFYVLYRNLGKNKAQSLKYMSSLPLYKEVLDAAALKS
ncbi:MAG: hypothetical protein L3J17_14690 [Candidatus Jettenia sp.]|nr:MAG: hypothetical protein L3J17_14690 [Candidatus Jettenia sp.]